MDNDPVAHIAEDGRKHGLYEHLTGTAEKAREFAAEFGCGEWGYVKTKGKEALIKWMI